MEERAEMLRAKVASLALTCALSPACKDEEPLEAPPVAPVTRDEPRDKAEQARGRGDLEQLVGSLRKGDGDYLAPSAAELTDYVDWFAHLSTAIDKRRLPTRGAPDGFFGRFVDGGRLWVMAERKQAKRGAGVLVLRADTSSQVVLQAPHTFFDSGTLPLALTLFDELGARALMLNTVHRAGNAGSKEERASRVRSGQSTADLAHVAGTYFQAIHESMLEQWKDMHFIQVHGFRDEQAPGVSVIVSAAGTRFDPLPVARALNDSLGAGAARIYPEEVKKLGGTTNLQARASKAKDRGFLHLEISSSLRTRLEREETLRRQFADALARALLLR